MDSQYISGVSLHPSTWLKQYEGMPGYPERLLPVVVIRRKNHPGSTLQYYDTEMIQLLNTALPHHRDTFELTFKLPFLSSLHSLKLFRTDVEREFVKERARMMDERMPFSEDVRSVIAEFQKEDERRKIQWGIAPGVNYQEMNCSGYMSYKIHVFDETKEPKREMKVVESRERFRRLIFGFFKNGVLQKDPSLEGDWSGFFQHPVDWSGFFQRPVECSRGVYTVWYNRDPLRPSDFPQRRYLKPYPEYIPIPYKTGMKTVLLEEVPQRYISTYQNPMFSRETSERNEYEHDIMREEQDGIHLGYA